MHEEMLCIGEITNDYEADVIVSVFQGHNIHCVVQGRNHRRMMGMAGGQLIRMRLLVPREDEELARELLQKYYDNLADESVEDEEIEGLRFNRKAQKLGLSLIALAVLGGGAATWVARLRSIAMILIIVRLLCFVDFSAQVNDWKHVANQVWYATYMIDLCIAWVYILSKPESFFHTTSE